MNPQERLLRALLAKRQERYILGVKVGIGIDVLCLAACLYNFAVVHTLGWIELLVVTTGLLAGACYDLKQMRETLDRTRRTV